MNATAKQKSDSVCFTTKGQVVIPSWLRKEFSIEDGTRAVVQATPEGILLKPRSTGIAGLGAIDGRLQIIAGV